MIRKMPAKLWRLTEISSKIEQAIHTEHHRSVPDMLRLLRLKRLKLLLRQKFSARLYAMAST
jgi:hypothetical protein